MEEYTLAIEQGSTSTSAMLFDKQGKQKAISKKQITQYFPETGFVEQDANEIWISVMYVVMDLVRKSSIKPENIKAISITNQRGTTVVWDKNTGVPVYHAIVWQSRQSVSICDEMKAEGYEQLIKEKTGLILNPYFPATKIKWILDHVEGARKKAEAGELMFGTIDSWLGYKMTRDHVHVTDYSNASRTLLYNIHERKWDEQLLQLFEIPKTMLPEVKDSTEIYGYTDPCHFFDMEIPVAGMAEVCENMNTADFQ